MTSTLTHVGKHSRFRQVKRTRLPGAAAPAGRDRVRGRVAAADERLDRTGAYYQIHVIADIYIQPTLTHIPNPGRSPRLSPATAITISLTVLF